MSCEVPSVRPRAPLPPHRARSAAWLVFATWVLCGAAQGTATGLAQDAGATRDASPTSATDAGTSDAGTSDAGTSDAGTSDAGTSDAGTSDAGTSDAALPAAASGEPTEGTPLELTGEHRPDIEAHITPTEGLVTGDAFELELRVSVPSGDDVAVPEQSFAPFEILEKHRRVEEGAPGRHTFVFRLRLLALAPGDQGLGPVSLRVVTDAGVIGHAETEAFELHVQSALGNEPHAEPKPPTQPVSVMVEDYTLAWIAGALATIVLVVLLTLWFARWWSRREREAAPPPPPRPPWELALARLETLRSGRVEALQGGRGAEWVDGLSDAMRDYLGGRYGFDGLECTTDEVIDKLRDAPLVGLSIAEIAALLGECDLVKFADVGVEEEQLDRLISEAFRMVRATIPHMGSRPAGQATGPSDQPSAATPAEGPERATGGPETAVEGDPQESLRRRWGPPEPEREVEAGAAEVEAGAAEVEAGAAEVEADAAEVEGQHADGAPAGVAEATDSEPRDLPADGAAVGRPATADPAGADGPEGGTP